MSGLDRSGHVSAGDLLSDLDVSIDQIKVSQSAEEIDLLEQMKWALISSWSRSGSSEIDELGGLILEVSDSISYELRLGIESLIPLVSDDQITAQLKSRLDEIRNQERNILDSEWKETQQNWLDIVNGMLNFSAAFALISG